MWNDGRWSQRCASPEACGRRNRSAGKLFKLNLTVLVDWSLEIRARPTRRVQQLTLCSLTKGSGPLFACVPAIFQFHLFLFAVYALKRSRLLVRSLLDWRISSIIEFQRPYRHHLFLELKFFIFWLSKSAAGVFLHRSICASSAEILQPGWQLFCLPNCNKYFLIDVLLVTEWVGWLRLHICQHNF